MNQTPTHQALQPKFRLLVLLVSIGFFMQGLDSTIVNTAIPSMAIALQENPLRMHNVVLAYVLTVAACIPVSGWLADRFGVRNTYLSAIIIFTLASLGCGVSTTVHQLLFFRVLQGIGGALLLPVGRLSLLKIIPRTQFLAAMSLMSLAGLLGPLIGPILGGFLVEITSWHWIFLINLPVGLIGIVMTLKVMPNVKEASVKSFDFKGLALLVIAMVGCSLSIELLASSGTDYDWSISFLVAGLIASFYYAYHAHTHENALFRSRLFRNRIYCIGILGNFIARFGGNSIPFILPLMLQVAFDYPPFITGLMMIPLVFGSLFSKPIIRPLIQQFGYRSFLLYNTLFVGLCIACFALMTASTPLWLKMLHFFIFGTLNSLQFVAMNTLTLKDLSQQDASSGNSFLSMIMMLSMSIGIAMAGTLINLFSEFTTSLSTTGAFHATLISLGIINTLALFIFWNIPKNTAL